MTLWGEDIDTGRTRRVSIEEQLPSRNFPSQRHGNDLVTKRQRALYYVTTRLTRRLRASGDEDIYPHIGIYRRGVCKIAWCIIQVRDTVHVQRLQSNSSLLCPSQRRFSYPARRGKGGGVAISTFKFQQSQPLLSADWFMSRFEFFLPFFFSFWKD